MYSIVLMMALGQTPAPVVAQDTAFYQEPVQYGETTRRGLFRGRTGRFRSRGTAPANYDNGSAVYQPAGYRPGMIAGPNTRSYYLAPGQAAPTQPTPAEMVVHLPPDATLTVDGEPTKQTSNTRVFITPELKPGMEYTYELKAQVQRPDGPVTTTQKVRVVPGQATEVVMNLPGSILPADEMAPTNTPTSRRRILRR